MSAPYVRDFHVHIYFDADQIDQARALAGRLAQAFALPVGHFHTRPVGPHPRGSVQLTVPVDRFGAVASSLSIGRDGLTIFAHASTGDDLSDHRDNVVWFGPSEALDLTIFNHA